MACVTNDGRPPPARPPQSRRLVRQRTHGPPLLVRGTFTASRPQTACTSLQLCAAQHLQMGSHQTRLRRVAACGLAPKQPTARRPAPQPNGRSGGIATTQWIQQAGAARASQGIWQKRASRYEACCSLRLGTKSRAGSMKLPRMLQRVTGSAAGCCAPSPRKQPPLPPPPLLGTAQRSIHNASRMLRAQSASPSAQASTRRW
jgi:hypothetical protein